jgi:hypothetical protein
MLFFVSARTNKRHHHHLRRRAWHALPIHIQLPGVIASKGAIATPDTGRRKATMRVFSAILAATYVLQIRIHLKSQLSSPTAPAMLEQQRPTEQRACYARRGSTRQVRALPCPLTALETRVLQRAALIARVT